MIRHHADINYQGLDGLTSLHIAAQSGQIEAVKLLLAAGADRRISTGPHGFTAADLAWSAHQPEIISLLEDNAKR